MLSKAIRLAEWFSVEAERLYAAVVGTAKSEDEILVHRVLDFLRANGTWKSCRDVCRKFRKVSATQISMILDELASRELIETRPHPDPSKTGRKLGPQYRAIPDNPEAEARQ